MRGTTLVKAATLIAAICRALPNRRQLDGAYLGLVPSEHSSGTGPKCGGLIKDGNTTDRRRLRSPANRWLRLGHRPRRAAGSELTAATGDRIEARGSEPSVTLLPGERRDAIAISRTLASCVKLGELAGLLDQDSSATHQCIRV